MRHGRPLAPLALALVLAVVAVAIARGPAPDAGVVPAPPPAGSCRLAPPEGWPAVAGTLPPPDLTPFQDYRAGLGIDGTERGAGVTIADIEYDWRASHAEFAGRGLPAPPAWRYAAEDHGTAVLAILGGADDGRGVTGLAPDATLVPISPPVPLADPAAPVVRYQPWEQVTAAAAGLGPGDVILIELQAGLSNGSPPYAPIEVYEPMRKAIRAAVDKGIVVVEPAGNSALDIGVVEWLSGPDAPGHSGALIVAGGGAGADEAATPDLARAGDSNFGARVDLQGYGSGVVTAGRGAPWATAPADVAYTSCFDGTSSAAATVAGAVAVLQGAAIARNGVPLTPAQVRELLVSTGAPPVGAGDGWIGPRPDVAAAIAALPPPPPPPAPPPPPPAPPVSGDAAPPPAETSTPPGPAGAAPGPRPAAPPVPSRAAPAPPAATATGPRTIPAARGLGVRLDRRARTVRLVVRGLAPRAAVRVAGRRVAVRRGGVVMMRRAPRGRMLVRVTAPRRAGVTVRPAVFRVVMPLRGAPRVVRVR